MRESWRNGYYAGLWIKLITKIFALKKIKNESLFSLCRSRAVEWLKKKKKKTIDVRTRRVDPRNPANKAKVIKVCWDNIKKKKRKQ